MNIDVSKYTLTEEEQEKLREFRKNGNKYMEEEGKGVQTFMWTEQFIVILNAFRSIMDMLDFSEPFRVIVDYDPEQKRTFVTQYAPEYPERFKRLL